MSLSHSLLPEFDQEMANTRKTLERVPEDRFEWRSHEKSPTLGWLATHLANLPGWATVTLSQNEFDLAPPEGAPQIPLATSREELLKSFDENVAAARAAIEGATDEQLMEKWSLLKGGKTILTLPRIAILRSVVMNHSIHHRAQLGVYLRLNDVPVPSIYGPSADENPF